MSCHQERKFGSHFSSARCRRLSSERFTLLGIRSYKFIVCLKNQPQRRRGTEKPSITYFVFDPLFISVPLWLSMSSCNQTAPSSACHNLSTRHLDQQHSVSERSSSAKPSSAHRFSCPSFPVPQIE